jgi:hypothetical protein
LLYLTTLAITKPTGKWEWLSAQTCISDICVMRTHGVPEMSSNEQVTTRSASMRADSLGFMLKAAAASGLLAPFEWARIPMGLGGWVCLL